jgi:3-hydroxybutyryl-CoA dehydratase
MSEESPVTLSSTTFGELEVGRRFGDAVTVEDWHLDTAADLFRDYNPLHTDAEAAARSIHGKRIIQGTCTSGMMMGTIGNAFAGTGLGMLGIDMRYKAPAFVGDTLSWEWDVVELDEKPRHNGGVAKFAGTCRNQDGAVLVTATAALMVSNEALG